MLIIIITFFPRALARLRQLDQTKADEICLSYIKADGFDIKVGNMSGDSRLTNSLWGTFVSVFCVIFNKECYVSIQYNLLDYLTLIIYYLG